MKGSSFLKGEMKLQFRTHLVTTLAVTVPIMSATDTLTIGTIAAVSLGALFPDIDEPHSWSGVRTRGVSDIIKGLFGHRGMTHSISGVFLVFLTMVLLVGIIGFPTVIATYFILGYLLHLIEDSFSKSGIKWFLPFSNKSYQSGLGIVYYKTGSMVENLILLGAAIMLIVQIQGLGIGNLLGQAMSILGI